MVLSACGGNSGSFTPEDVGPQGRFGASVSVSDEYQLVGAPGHSESGAVFVFEEGSSKPSSVIVPFQGNPGDGFGSAVDVVGTTALIGAPISEINGILSGRAFIYRLDAEQGLWIQDDDLGAETPSDLDYFGTAVALGDNVAVVGAPGDDELGSNAGAAYVFSRGVSGWTLVSKLTAPNGAEGDRFGESVAVSGDRLLIGAPFGSGRQPRTGVAYVYQVGDSTGTFISQLEPEASAADQGFGAAVALTDDLAFIGAPGPGNAEAPGGSLSIFAVGGMGGTDERLQVITSGPSIVDEGFGASVDHNGEFLIVGSQREVGDHPGPGSAHIFTRSGGSWSELTALAGSEAAKADGYGGSVSIASEHAAVGAAGDGATGPNSGAVYFYEGGSGGWK